MFDILDVVFAKRFRLASVTKCRRSENILKVIDSQWGRISVWRQRCKMLTTSRRQPPSENHTRLTFNLHVTFSLYSKCTMPKKMSSRFLFFAYECV